MKIKIVKEVPVIFVEYVKGNGTEKDPIRIATQYWDLNGNLITELDDYDLINDSASLEIK